MLPRLLFLIGTDPRRSPRPAEAIRVAAGIGAWQKAEVSVYLRAAAVLALGEYVDGLVDEDNFSRYLPILGEWGRPVLVQGGSAWLGELGQATLPFREIDDDELARLTGQCSYVLRF